jgi:uncharacterized membrane protein
MSNSGHIWAVAFDDVSRADLVCGEVKKLAERHSLILDDWAIAVRSVDGTFTVDGEPLLQPKPHGRLANFLAGLALGAPPLTCAAVDIFVSHQSGGAIGHDFIGEVKDLMQPGSSALFIVDRAGDLHAILDAIRGLGGTVLKTNVDLERARLVQSTLAATTTQSDPKHD